MNIRFQKNGIENGKTAYFASRRAAGMWITNASILWDGEDWTVIRSGSGRIDRFERLADAKDELRKGL